ncbi:hypothetical protein ABPG72_007001 [Tetrahymena utriculariae]
MKNYQENLIILREQEWNDRCFECSDKLFEQFSVSINLGIFLCIRHSTQHLLYGRKISYIKEYNCSSWDDSNLEFIKQGGNLQFKKYLSLKGIKKFIFNKKFYSSEIVNRYRYLLGQKVLKVISVEDLNEIQGYQQEEQIEETKVDLDKSEYVQQSIQESEVQSEVQSVSDQDNIINSLTEFQISNSAKQDATPFNIYDLDRNSGNDLNKGLYQRIPSNYYKNKMVDGNCITLMIIKDENDLKSQKIIESQIKQAEKEQKLHDNNEQSIYLDSEKNSSITKDKEKKDVKLIFNENQGNKRQDLKPFQSANSLSSSSTSSSSTKFVSTLAKSINEDKQKISKKEQIFGFFSKAKEKYQEAKVSLKESAKNLIYDINQKVYDPQTQIKIQMIKEDVRTKTMEAQEIIEEQASHLKDYATTTLETFKNKIKDKIKEKNIDKEIVDLQQQIREKYLELEVYTDNLASKKMKQIKNYLHTENIENEPFETIGSESGELNKSTQNLQKQNLTQKNIIIDNSQDIQTNNQQEEQKNSLKQISQSEKEYLEDKYKKNINKQLDQNNNNNNLNIKQMNAQPESVLFIDEQHSYNLLQIQEDDSIFQSQEQNQHQYEEEEEKKERDETQVSNQVQRNDKQLNLVQDQKNIFKNIYTKPYITCNQDKVLFLDECSQENNNNKSHMQEDESIFDSFNNQKM